MSDTTTTTTPGNGADYASSFPNSPTMFEAPAARPVDPAEITYREAFPSMFQRQPEPATPDPAEGTMYRAAVKRGPEAAPDAGETAADAPAPTSPALLPLTGITINVPAGFELTREAVDAFDLAARESRLDAAGAQRLFDLHHQGLAGLRSEADTAWASTVAEWREAVAKDPEVGGAALKANVAAAQAVIGKYGTPALKRALNDTGLGNHPELIRFVHRVGRALASTAASTSDVAAPRVDEPRDYSRSFPSMFRR